MKREVETATKNYEECLNKIKYYNSVMALMEDFFPKEPEKPAVIKLTLGDIAEKFGIPENLIELVLPKQ